jgi:hypothetical protein
MSMTVTKTVGSSGQISLGKEYAGRLVLIDELEPGVWVVKLGRFVPDSEQWLAKDSVQQEIAGAINWAKDHPPAATDLDALEQELNARERP